MKTKSKNNSFINNILTYLTGNVLSQFIPLIFSVIITRLYTPEEYGIYGTFFTIISLLIPISTLKYEQAIMLPKSKHDALIMFRAVVYILIIMTGFLFLLIIVFNNQYLEFISFIFSNSELSKEQLTTLSKWSYILPFFLFSAALIPVISLMLNRQQNYKLDAKARVGQALVSNILQVLFGIIKIGEIGLLISGFVSQLYYIFRTGFKRFRKYILSFWKLDKDFILQSKSLLKKYYQFPLISLPNSILDMARLHGVVLILTYYFGTAIVGQYLLMNRIIRMPSTLVGVALSQVSYQKISEMYSNNERDIYPFLKRNTIYLILIGIIPFGILFFFGEDLFKFVFGNQWAHAGKYAEYLSPYMYSYFIVSTLGIVPIVYGKQLIAFLFSTLSNLAQIIIYIYGGIQNNIEFSLISVSIVVPTIFIFYVLWIFRFTKKGVVQ